MEQSVESYSFEKFKAIASLPILFPSFRFKKKKRFHRKSSQPGNRNLVLITSTVQVELSNLNFNFDDIRTNVPPVLTFYDFSRLFCDDDARQNRAELTLIIKIYNNSFIIDNIDRV